MDDTPQAHQVSQEPPPRLSRIGRRKVQASNRLKASKHRSSVDKALVGPMAHVIADKIVDDSQRYIKFARATFLDGAPLVAARLVKIALGKVKAATVADQVAAGKIVLAHAGMDPEGPAGSRAALTELSLDQLESLISGTLGAIQDAKAIDSKGIRVPSQGTGQPVDALDALDQAPAEEGVSERPLTPGGGGEP